uniref:Armadillo repeat-containing domain-containing protein n=1 Tax=Clastoptera arizonana TaxID=38151 RepID=A0A1B6C4W5_9HEMI
MFSTKEMLIKRSGKNKIGRFEFLKQIVSEFKTTNNLEAKQQVMANLANFAYDPINYDFLRSLGVIDLFLDQLAENNPTLAQYALGGLCNLVLDSQNKEYVLANGGVNHISPYLLSKNDDMVLSAISTLMFLVTPVSKNDITNDVVIQQMLELSKNQNQRISNLAKIFLEDYCPRDRVTRIENLINIPLPS